jgi:hypothetical protein
MCTARRWSRMAAVDGRPIVFASTCVSRIIYRRAVPGTTPERRKFVG